MRCQICQMPDAICICHVACGPMRYAAPWP
jgi:hypothetical protein